MNNPRKAWLLTGVTYLAAIIAAACLEAPTNPDLATSKMGPRLNGGWEWQSECQTLGVQGIGESTVLTLSGVPAYWSNGPDYSFDYQSNTWSASGTACWDYQVWVPGFDYCRDHPYDTECLPVMPTLADFGIYDFRINGGGPAYIADGGGGGGGSPPVISVTVTACEFKIDSAATLAVKIAQGKACQRGFTAAEKQINQEVFETYKRTTGFTDSLAESACNAAYVAFDSLNSTPFWADRWGVGVRDTPNAYGHSLVGFLGHVDPNRYIDIGYNSATSSWGANVNARRELLRTLLHEALHIISENDHVDRTKTPEVIETDGNYTGIPYKFLNNVGGVNQCVL